MSNSVLIIDFGSQVTQLIARRIRELGVFCEVKNSDISLDEIKKIAPKAIIFSGGPNSVYEKGAPTIDKKIFELKTPIFGICYGQQLICHLLGGKVTASKEREFGKAELDVIVNSKFFKAVKSKQVWMSHGDSVKKIPAGFEVIAKTKNAPYAAIADEKRKIYGVQFHPEVVHSVDGKKMIENFVINISGCKSEWTMKNFKKEEIARVKKVVGKIM